METSYFPVWKKWVGLGSDVDTTIALFTSEFEAKHWENNKLNELCYGKWISCYDARWENCVQPFDFLPKYSLDIQEERHSDYGDASESFDNIATFWSTYLTRRCNNVIAIDKIDVAHMMELFKISRNAYKRKEDNMVDGESYANFARKFFNESN